MVDVDIRNRPSGSHDFWTASVILKYLSRYASTLWYAGQTVAYLNPCEGTMISENTLMGGGGHKEHSIASCFIGKAILRRTSDFLTLLNL